MKVIYKYVVTREIELPVGATILSAQFQNERLVLWALIDPDEETQEARKFVLRATGEMFNDVDNLQFIATLQTRDLVWHLFEERR